MSGLMLPGRATINVEQVDGPNATPATVVVQNGANGMQVFLFGGLSKMEAIMAQLLSGSAWDSEREGYQMVLNAADIAEQIIAEAAKRTPEAISKENGRAML